MCAYSTESQVLYAAGVTANDVEGGSSAIAQFIAWADAEIEARTNKTWNTPTSQTDYFDVQENVYHQDWLKENGLASYSKPYAESRHYVRLTKSPVTSIDAIAILKESETFDYAYNVAGTDVTDDINDVRGTPVEFDGGTLNNSFRFVSPSLVYGIGVELNTAGADGEITLYYYDSDGNLHEFSNVSDGTSNLTTNGKITWSMPDDWEEYDDGSVKGYQFIMKVTTSIYTTNPKFSHIYLIDPVSSFVDIGTVAWRSSGELYLRSNWLDSGIKNLKVIYKAGASSVPALVSELSANLAAQKLLMNMMGASFDSSTNVNIGGEISYATGEQYASQQRTLEKLRKRELELWDLVGKKIFVEVV